jgi:hypothetical protein
MKRAVPISNIVPSISSFIVETKLAAIAAWVSSERR